MRILPKFDSVIIIRMAVLFERGAGRVGEKSTLVRITIVDGSL